MEPQCPSCLSQNVAVLEWYSFKAPERYILSSLQCDVCGNQWKDRVPNRFYETSHTDSSLEGSANAYRTS